MIIGAHSIIYSTHPAADRAFLRDVLKMPHVDVGDGWLIFGLPPAEVAVHPSSKNDLHEFYLMCSDVEAFMAAMKTHGIACEPVQDMGWGRLTQVRLPGGGKLGVYQPRHARPGAMAPAKPRITAAGKGEPRAAAAGRATRAAAKGSQSPAARKAPARKAAKRKQGR